MKIFIAADHGGYYLKEELKNFLVGIDHEVEDLGNTKFDPNDDYPDFIFPLAHKVAKDKGSLGIVLGRSGNGEVIAANKVKGVYAALCLSTTLAKKAREHNAANVISLGADFVSVSSAKKIVAEFLSEHPSLAKKHTRRVKKIIDYESAHLR